MKGEKTMNWVTIVLGVALFLAPFVFGYSGTPWALWTSLILGTVVAILGYKQTYKAAAIVGLVVFVAPWILGFSGVPGALWSYLLLGGAVALLAGYRGFISEKETQAGSVRHHAA
jgi:hypothetical protein